MITAHVLVGTSKLSFCIFKELSSHTSRTRSSRVWEVPITPHISVRPSEFSFCISKEISWHVSVSSPVAIVFGGISFSTDDSLETVCFASSKEISSISSSLE